MRTYTEGRDHPHYHSCDTKHPCKVVHDILFTATHEAVLLAECSIREVFSSVLLNVQDVAESCTCSITCLLYGHIGTIHKFIDY